MIKKSAAIFIIFFTFVLLLGFSGTGISETPNGNESEIKLIVQVEGDVQADSIAESKEKAKAFQEPVINHIKSLNGTTVTGTLWSSNSIIVKIDTGKTTKAAVGNHSAVKEVIEDEPVKLPNPPQNERQAGTQDYSTISYGLEQIRADDAQKEFNATGEGVKVAVIDTGASISHPDIDVGGDPSNNYKGYWAVVEGDVKEGSELDGTPEPFDPEGHGTHVAGTVIGESDNSAGTQIGVAPNATAMHVQAFNANGTSNTTNIVKSIEWAAENDADVITMSFSAGSSSAVLDATRMARNQGAILVGASGNYKFGGNGNTAVPAASGDVISVGAVDGGGTVPTFSGGAEYDPTEEFTNSFASEWENPLIAPYVVAPGVSVYSASHTDNGLVPKTGTSMATPHVGGTSAIALSNNPSLTQDEFEYALMRTARNADGYSERNTRQGYGIVDAYEVLQATNPNGYFSPANVRVTQMVDSGDNLVVNATVSNENLIGDTGTQNVSLYVGDRKVSVKEDVVIESDTETEVGFVYETTGADSGEKVVTVGTENKNATNTTSVRAPADFIVSIAPESEREFVTGEEANITVGVENVGESSGSGSLNLFVNGEARANSSTTIPETAPDETRIVDVPYTPTKDDVGTPTIRVESATDSIEAAFNVIGYSTFSVNLSSAEIANQSFVIGETVPVNATIENTGGAAGIGTVDLLVNGTVKPDASVDTRELSTGETQSVSLGYNVSVEDYPEANVSIRTSDDEQNTTVGVLRAAESVVGINSVNSPTEGDDIVVNASVENVGDVSLSQTLTANIDGIGSNETAVTVANGSSEDVELHIPTGDGDAGEYTVTAATPDSTSEIPVTVRGPAAFDVGIANASSDVSAGNNVTVNASVANTGGEIGEETVSLTTNTSNTVRDSATVEVPAGESEVVELEFKTTVADMGDVQLQVTVSESSATQNIVVSDPEPPVITGVTVNESVSNNVVEVNGTVANGSVDVRSIEMGVSSSFTSFTAENAVTGDVSDGGEFNVTIDTRSLVGDGTYDSFVGVTDESGQYVESNGEQVRVDATAPEIQLGTTGINGANGDVVVESSEAFEITSIAITADNDEDRSPQTIPSGLNTDSVTVPFDSSATGGDKTEFNITVTARDEVENTVTETLSSSVSNYELTNGDGRVSVSNFTNITVNGNETELGTGSLVRQAVVSSGSSTPAGTNLDSNRVSGGYVNVADIGVSDSELDNATIRIPVENLNEDAINGFESDELTIFKSEDGEQGYSEVPTEYDSETGELVAVVDGFSQFVAGGTDTTPPSIDAVDVTPGEDVTAADGPVTVRFEYSEETSSVNVSATDVTADVSNARVTKQVTQNNAELTVDGLSNGETITVDVVVADEAGNSVEDTVTITVSEDSNEENNNENNNAGGGGGGSSGGGGGGGGGGAGVPEPPSLSTLPDDVNLLTDADGTIRGGANESTFSFGAFTQSPIVEGGTLHQGGFDGIARVLDFDGVPSSVGSPPGEVFSTTDVMVPREISDSSATLTFNLGNVEYKNIAYSELNTEELTVWRHTGEDWEPLETRVVEQSADGITLEADTTGFSYFVVTDESELPEEAGADDAASDESPVTNDDTPGFGVVVTLIAVLMSVIAVRSRH
ncbi:S8 family serine peptidase [Halohasta litorea]|uniref:S8 family serine peptidase n=1 Tax=Halohasta litorea TaxID=869891 RepID=A0ABD6D8X1_9EURY|nr:S8 family serine peptidase [Halohasta litorea]